jgi:hypothetical protein
MTHILADFPDPLTINLGSYRCIRCAEISRHRSFSKSGLGFIQESELLRLYPVLAFMQIGIAESNPERRISFGRSYIFMNRQIARKLDLLMLGVRQGKVDNQ